MAAPQVTYGAPMMQTYAAPVAAVEIDKVNAFGQVVERDFVGAAPQMYMAPQQMSYIPQPQMQMQTIAAPAVEIDRVNAFGQVVERDFVGGAVMAAPQVTYGAPMMQTYAAPVAAVEIDKVNAFGQVVERDFVGAAPQMYMAPQQVSYIPQPQMQTASYIPAAAPIVQTYAAPQVASYIPQPQVIETMAPQMAYAAPQQAVYAEQVVTEVMEAGGQSVVVEQVGDWLVCEDAAGIFYHHTPSQQSMDDCPQEFLALFPGGYQPPPLGAFAAAGAFEVAPVAYAAMPQAMPQMQYAQQGGMPMMETVVQAAPQVMYAQQPMVQQFQGQQMVEQVMMQQQGFPGQLVQQFP